MGATHNQMPAQGEVSVVHSDNSQGDLTIAMTDDNIDQTVRVATSDSDQRPVDGTTPETIIDLADLPSIATVAEFKHMFQYLKGGSVTDNDDQDGRPLLH